VLYCGIQRQLALGANVVARKKKKEFLWNPEFDPQQSKEQIINTLETFWIPLLEEALYQAKRLLSKLKKESS